MKKLLLSLPAWLEFAIVMVVAFALPVFASVSSALHPAASVRQSSASLIALPAVEIGLSAILGIFLWGRGWTFRRLGFASRVLDPAIGLALFVAAYAAWAMVFYLTYAVSPGTVAAISAKAPTLIAHHIPLWIIWTVVIVNPVFEEVFETGYIVAALKRGDNAWPAINVSVGVRLLCHLYQGPMGVLSTIPIGLIFALWFARTGRLWPVIVAHAVIDLLALYSYSRM